MKSPTPESETANERADINSAALRKVHDRAMRRFDTVALPQQEIRATALQARRFVTIPGAQWEGWDDYWPEDAPKPEVDKITKSLEKIETDYRENRLTVDFVAVGNDADNDTAQTLDGMFRADAHDFKAMQAWDNAFQECIRGGFGAWRLTTDYADPYDREDGAQRVNPGYAIVDADQSVYFDGNSILYDKRDAKWAFVITAMPREAAEDDWGTDLCDWPTTKLYQYRDWFTPDTVLIAEYYEKQDVDDKLLIFTQEVSGEEQRFFDSEMLDGQAAELSGMGFKSKTKKIKRCRVRKYIMSGAGILRDVGFIAGPNIPIVPVYGRRDFVDKQERFRGHVTKLMDRQRIYNTRVAKLVERDAVSPGEKPIFDPSQIDANQAEQWARAHVDRLPYLTAHALRNPDGSIAATGPIGAVKESDVPPVTALLLQAAAADLTDDDDNADQVKANTSAEAMELAAARVDAKSGIYLDNMRQSLEWCGEIYKGMSREVYYEPGRKVATLSQDGKDDEATLVERYMGDDNVYRIRNNLAQGRYKVIASVQESTATKRQKTVKQDLEIAAVAVQAQDMDLARASINHAVLNMDGEGTQDLQDWVRQRLVSQGVVKPTPEEAEAMEKAAENQQPDPVQMLATAQAQEAQSKVLVNQASADEKQASALLKVAQAHAVGGPVSAPDTESGLSAPEVEERSASADLKRAQAEKLRAETRERPIRMGHEMEMSRRQQDLAERNTGGE